MRFYLLLFFSICANIGQSQNWEQMGSFNRGEFRAFLDDTTSGLLYISGGFLFSGPDTLKGFCSWDGKKFTNLGEGRNCGNVDCDNPASFVAKFNGEIYYSGPGLKKIGGVQVNGIGKWDGAKWSAALPGLFYDEDSNPYLSGFCIQDDRLYGVGAFRTANGDTCNSVAYWDGIKWTGLGFKGNIWTNSVPSVTKAIFYKNELYVSGNFYVELDGEANSDIARYDGTQWHSVGGGVKGGMGDIWDMVIYKDELYVCGYFQGIDGNAGNKIMRWDGQQWKDVGGGMCGIGETATDMMVFEDKLIVAGIFDCVANGLPAGNIASWDGERWCSFGQSYMDNRISEMTNYKGDIIIGGGFKKIDGQPVKHLAKWVGDHATDTCSAPISSAPEPSAMPHLRLSPNPASGQVTVTFSNSKPVGLLRVVSMLGAVVREVPVSASQTVLSTADLPAGVYVVQHIEEDVLRAVGKVVVQR